MRPSKKMWLLMMVGVVVVVAQYHVSSSWLMQASAAAAAAAAATLDAGMGATSNSLPDDVVRRLQDSPLASAITTSVLRQLVVEVARELGVNSAATPAPAAPAAPAAVTTASPTSPRPTPTPVTLYIITPTYRRAEQIAELTRMGQTLMHVPNVHWLVIEDAANRTQQVTELLARTGLRFEHLVAPMPDFYKAKRGPKPRGVSNRNRGLQWLRKNATSGVLYFADDDNTYDIQLFEEIRTTKRVSMWPVGLCTRFGLSSPIVRSNGSFAGFYDGWIAGRKFPVDMAGFAVNVAFLLTRPKAFMPYRPGFEEDGFLKSLAPFEPKEIELKADNCTLVLVWHTQTKRNEPSALLDEVKYNNTNLLVLKTQIV